MGVKTGLPQMKDFSIVEMTVSGTPSYRSYYVWHVATGGFVGRWEHIRPTLKQIRVEWVARRLAR